jgi:hypothetical protein
MCDLNQASYHTYEKANYLPKTLQNPITWRLVVKNYQQLCKVKIWWLITNAVEIMMLVGFGVESPDIKKNQIVITKLWNSNHKLTKAPKKKKGGALGGKQGTKLKDPCPRRQMNHLKERTKKQKKDSVPRAKFSHTFERRWIHS